MRHPHIPILVVSFIIAGAGCGDTATPGGTLTDTADAMQSDTAPDTAADTAVDFAPDTAPDTVQDHGSPDPGPTFPQSVCVPKVTLTGGTPFHGRGIANAVVSAGQIAWVGTSVGIERVDITTPATPIAAGSLDLPAPVSALALTESRLLATAGSNLYILDAATLSIAHTIALPGPGADLAVASTHLAWVIAGDSFVRIDLTSGTLTHLLPLNDRAQHLALDATGQLAVVTLATAGLVTVDLTPKKPAIVGTHPAFERDFDTVLIHNGIAWVGTPYEGLHGFDLSDPAAPTFLVTGDPQWGWLPGQIVRVGDLLYIGDRYPNPKIRVLDIANPSAPVAIGTLSSPKPALGLAANGDLLLVASDQAGLGIASLTAPEAPTWTGRLDADGSARSLSRDGDHLIVADGPGGIRTLDANTLDVLSTHPLPTNTVFALRHQNVLYALATNIQVAGQSRMELAVLDALDPTADPIDIIVLKNQASGMALLGQTLVVAGTSGLHAYDISSPENPVAGTVLPKGAANLVVVERPTGPVAFVGSNTYPNGTLDAFEETGPGQISALGSVSFPGYGGPVAVQDDLAVVVGFTGTVNVFDVSDASAMTLRGTARIDAKAFSVTAFAASESSLSAEATEPAGIFAITSALGLIGLDVTDPDHPMLLGDIAMPGTLAQVLPDGQGGYFAADGDQLVSRFTVACKALDTADAAPVPSSSAQRRAALFNGVSGVATLTATVNDSDELDAPHTRVSTSQTVTDGPGTASVTVGSSSWDVDFAADETLLLAAGTSTSPRLVSIGRAEPATVDDASVRLANISNHERVDAVLIVAGKHLPLGGLGKGSAGPSVSIPAGFPARIAMTVQGGNGNVFDVPPLAAGDSVVAVVADPDSSSDADLPLYVAWIDQEGLAATLSGSGPDALLASTNAANTQVRVVNLGRDAAIAVHAEGQALPGATPLARLGSSEPTFVAHGAVQFTVQSPDDGEVLETHRPIVGLPGAMHTVALMPEPGAVAVIPNFTGQQTPDEAAELRVLNAAWQQPVSVSLLDHDDSVAYQWEDVAYGVVPTVDARPDAGSYRVRVDDGESVWTFDLGYFPDYGQVIYFARSTDGAPLASTQSSASTAFFWRGAQEVQARVRMVNLDGEDVDFGWLSPNGVGGAEAQVATVASGASTPWHATPGTTQTLTLGGQPLPVNLPPGSWTTVFLVDGTTHVVTEPSAPSSAAACVRLVNASEATVSGWWNGQDLGSTAPTGVSQDLVADSKQGALTLDTDGDGAADLTFAVDGNGTDPVLGLYYLGGDVPKLLVHRSETYLTESYSNEATAWLRIVHLTGPAKVDVAAPDLGLPTVKTLPSSSPIAGFSLGGVGPLPVLPGSGDVTVGNATVAVALGAGAYTTLVLYGDSEAPSTMVIEGGGPTIANLSSAGAVNVDAELAGGEVISIASGLEAGTQEPFAPPESAGSVLLDANQDGIHEWQMFGGLFDDVTVIVYGTSENAATLYFSPTQEYLGTGGQTL